MQYTLRYLADLVDSTSMTTMAPTLFVVQGDIVGAVLPRHGIRCQVRLAMGLIDLYRASESECGIATMTCGWFYLPYSSCTVEAVLFEPKVPDLIG